MQKFEELYNDKQIIYILNSAIKRYRKSLSPEEIFDCKNDALWNFYQKHDDDKGNTEKNSLYRHVIWQCQNKIRSKNKKQVKTVHVNCNDICDGGDRYKELNDSVQSLPDEMKKIIIQKYYGRFTLKEIGSLNDKSVKEVKFILEEGIRRLQKIWGI
jgi:DNA-directed RNA polymerase specialized sigma24 family protein